MRLAPIVVETTLEIDKTGINRLACLSREGIGWTEFGTGGAEYEDQ